MRKRHVAALIALGIGATACSAPSDEPTTDRATDGAIDAQEYVDNYETNRDRDTAVAAPAGVEVDATAQDVPAPYPAPEPPPVPTITEDNTFVDAGESLWIAVDTQPVSTFGLDVDTGSLGVARTFLADGYLPEPDSIRVEEWLNSYTYGDVPPDQGALGLSVESGPAPRAHDGTALVRVGVSTMELSEAERPAANITFVVDVSGSMDIRSRLGLVQASLALLAETLRDDDTVSIVVYGDSAEVLLPPTAVADTDAILEAIDAMRIGGATNMEAGLLLGYEQARAGYDPDAVNVVILASDGVANVGTSEPGGLIDQITEAGKDGIHLVTVGFGMGNYNDHLMEQLANHGDGFYAYVDTFDEAERLFVDELTPTLAVVAHDVKAQVNFDPDQVAEYRLIGYQSRILDEDDFTDDTVDSGELGAGHQVTAVYQVRPVGELVPGAVLGQVSLRWAQESGGAAEQLDGDIVWSQDLTDSLELAALITDTAELLKDPALVADRQVSLPDLAAAASDLQARQVPGADDIAALIEAAMSATGSVGGSEDSD